MRRNRSASRREKKTQFQKPRSETSGRWVVGLHSVREAVRARSKSVESICFREDFQRSKELSELYQNVVKLGLKANVQSLGVLDRISSSHQGVAALVQSDPELNWNDLQQKEGAILVALDGIVDPQNLGSMLRTAWLTEVEGIFVPTDRSVGLTPTVCKIASGGAEHVPLVRTTALPEHLKRLKDLGFWIFGLAETGKNQIWDLRIPEKVVWVIGGEGAGMKSSTARACDEVVRIPQAASGSSYNAGVALAMVLYESMRQRSSSKG